MRDLKTHGVPSLDRALTVLEMLAHSRRGQSLADLARRMSAPKSTLHCVLLTLERRGYLERDETSHRYVFGLKLFSLVNSAISQVKVNEVALPVLHSLMEQTQMTIHMAILDQGEAVLVNKIEPPRLLRLATWIGKRMDIHCTGVGKALIAYLPSAQLEELLTQHPLPRHNENTIVSARKLKEQLKLIRKLGYAFDDEEDEIGLRCIGVPIFNHEDRVVAAISVAGTTAQITKENRSQLAELMKSAALAISRNLGFQPSNAAFHS